VFTVPTDVDRIEIDILCAASLLDTDLEILFEILASDDAEVTWAQQLYTGTWSGGTTNDDSGTPAADPWSAVVDVPPALRGLPMKAQITASKAVTLGAEIRWDP
jgi:hypothetical protein